MSRPYYVRKVWPRRGELTTGSHNVKAIPLVDPKNVLLPSLHNKLGIMKNCVRGLPMSSSVFKYLVEHFPHISDVNIKAGERICRRTDSRADEKP